MITEYTCVGCGKREKLDKPIPANSCFVPVCAECRQKGDWSQAIMRARDGVTREGQGNSEGI